MAVTTSATTWVGPRSLDFFAYLSGRYAVKRDDLSGRDSPISIEVYYDPAHQYDVDDMIASSEAGLAYYEKHYSPYQFRQYPDPRVPSLSPIRSIFPKHDSLLGRHWFHRTRGEAEGHRSDLLRYRPRTRPPMVGAPVDRRRVEGSNMMSETLAEYSALMVMQQKYGPDNMHRFLKHELDRYLRGRAGEIRRERPLALVQNEPYVWYQKGGQVMYTLADYIGEEKVDRALQNFLMQHRYANADSAQSGPYPDTRQFVDALRAQTPADLQYYIDDAFENIVLYDNKAVSATVTPTLDHKFKVSLKVQSRKLKADGSGNESPMTLNDVVDIGVFTGKKDEEKPLYLKKEKLTEPSQTFEIVVDSAPTRAGIDPYNKLIDRNADDNMIDVVRQ